MIRRKWLVAGSVVGAFFVAVLGMGVVKKQFFPTSDRPEVLVEVQMAALPSSRRVPPPPQVEAWLAKQPEAKTVTAYVGQGAPRFYLAMSPEPRSLVRENRRIDGAKRREALKLRLRQGGRWPGAGGRVRVTQLVFGPLALPRGVPCDGPDPTSL